MNTLDQIRLRWNQAKSLDNFGELDTIERLIIPILSLSGWDVDSLMPMCLLRGNRDNRSNNRQFDIALYLPKAKAPRFVFECKSLSQKITLEGKGASNNTSDQSDFARQIRNDCLSGNFDFEKDYTSPVLTNGYHWILFDNAFLQEERKNESINDENFDNFVLSSCTLDSANFQREIIMKFWKLVMGDNE